jgi:hypothetical protein
MWRFVQDRSHGRNGGIRSFAAFPPNILNLNGKSGFEQVHQYRERYRIIALQPCMRHPKLTPFVKTDKELSLVNPGNRLVIMPKNKRRDLHQICINV